MSKEAGDERNVVTVGFAVVAAAALVCIISPTIDNLLDTFFTWIFIAAAIALGLVVLWHLIDDWLTWHDEPTEQEILDNRARMAAAYAAKQEREAANLPTGNSPDGPPTAELQPIEIDP